MQQALGSGLKRQLRESRAENKQLQDELDSLKKSLRLTTQTELQLQVQLYQDECMRLRLLLEQELHQSQKNVVQMAQNHFNILSITSEEDKRKQMNSLQKVQQEVAVKEQQIQELSKEVTDLRKHQQEKEKKKSELMAKQRIVI